MSSNGVSTGGSSRGRPGDTSSRAGAEQICTTADMNSSRAVNSSNACEQALLRMLSDQKLAQEQLQRQQMEFQRQLTLEFAQQRTSIAKELARERKEMETILNELVRERTTATATSAFNQLRSDASVETDRSDIRRGQLASADGAGIMTPPIGDLRASATITACDPRIPSKRSQPSHSDLSVNRDQPQPKQANVGSIPAAEPALPRSVSEATVVASGTGSSGLTPALVGDSYHLVSAQPASRAFRMGGGYQPPKFSGELDVFLRQFQMCTRNFDLNDQERMASMHLALTG